MKRKFTFLNVALALLAFLTPATMGWGQTRGEITWTASEQGYTNQQEITSVDFDDFVSATFNKGTNSNPPKYYTSGTAIRCYGGNYFVFSTTSGNITKIVISFGSSDGSNEITTNVGSYSEGTWTGEAEEVTFTIGGTSGNRRIAGFSITYTSGGSTSVATTTTIDATGITNTDVYTSTAAGSLTATVTETESGNAVNGATVTWTSSKENVATIDENGVVTLVDAGTTTITASYAGVSGEFGASSATYELTVTSSAPASEVHWVLTNLADLTENDVFVIVGNNGENYAMKNTDASNTGPAAISVTVSGNELSGTVPDNIRWNISGNATDGYIFYPNGSTTTWLYCTNNNNGLRIGSGNTDYNTFEIKASYIYNTGRGRYVGIYNSTDWRSYTSSGGNIANQTFAFYKKVTGGVVPPSITATNVNIDYDALDGGIDYTVNNPVEGGSLRASCEEDWIYVEDAALTDAQGTITFLCDANTATTARTANVTLTYTYNTSETVTTTVTVTQAAAPVIYTTIPALFEDATSTETDVTVTFGGWVISAVKNSNAYLTDNAGNGLIIYQSDHGFQVNDVLTGTASCKLLIYRGSAELKNLTATTEGLTVTPNGTVTVQNIAISELSGVNTGALVAYANLTYTDGKLQDSEGNQITPYTTLYNYENIFVEGHVYNVTGIYLQYNTTKEILPRSADDIEEVTSTTPTVTVAETTINVGYEGIIDTLAVTYENITEVAAEVYFCDANGNAATFDWITAQIVAENNVEYTVEPNNGETRTAYFKVWAYDDDLNEVYSELVTVTQTAPPYSLTIGTLTHVTEILLFNSDNESQQIDVVNNVALITEGTTVMVSVEVEQGYVVQSLNVTYGDNQSAGITELEPNVYYSFEMPAANATLTITAVEPPQPAIYTYVKANSIQSGKHYIIVNEDSSKAMGLQNNNNRSAVDIDIIDANATAEYGKAYEFVITDLNETNTDNEALYSIYDVINEGYLCAASSSSNYLKMQNTLDDNGKWTIAIAEDGKATIKAHGSYTRNLMRYNSGSSLFSCYGSGQQDIYLYERVYTINITAHGDNENPTGWYLIASPLAGEINPTTIEGMIVTDDETTSNIDESEYFDLYRFDQSADLEWKNYKNNSFNLVSGQGYLYANANGVTLTFTGTPYEGNGKVGLVYSNDTNLDFPGWNLVGNPFGVAATINRDFYSMNGNGSEIVVGSSSIAAMEGVFVIATKANDTVTFTTTASAKSSEEIPIEVTVGRGSVIDRAIVRFGEGSTMPKFQLFENSTKLYIEQNGKDYAIVSAEAQGEMPVSFRAAKNGTYTLTVNPEGVEMNYLHLIDNMTGIDIDLLQTPNYTFEARTTDYTSRFRLVFGANGASAGSASDDTFAYFNGCEWMINNSGDATLQVVDVMGRVLSSEAVSGSVSKTINATPGVYMLRLVSGDTVKTQKIVVR